MTQLRNLKIVIYADTSSMHDCGRTVAADPRLARSRVDLCNGGILEAAAWLKSHPSPDVLLVGDSADEGILERLEQLAQAVEPGCKVIVVGRRDSIAIYRQLLAQGLADYIGGSVRPADMFDAIARLYAGGQNTPKGKLVVTLSTAGGAGGSTVAAFVAESLNDRLGETILLDLDLAMGTAGLMMGVDVRDAVAGAIANPGIDVSLLERTLTGEKGAKVLSTAGALKDAFLFNADAADRVVDVARSMSKALVIDLPKGWSDSHERLLIAANEVIVATTPDLPALRNARMILDHLVALRLDGAPPRLVLNKTGVAKAHEYRGNELREALGMTPSASVPWDPDSLMAAVVSGKAVTTARGKASSALRAFASTILAAPARGKPRPAPSLLPTLKALFVKPA